MTWSPSTRRPSRPPSWAWKPRPMFETLSGQLEEIFGRLRRKGRLRPQDIDEALAGIRRALLAADVAVPVVAVFRERVRERAVATDLHRALNPAQQVIQIVHDELVRTPRRRGDVDHVRPAASHCGAPRRPAGLGEDHNRRQAGALVPQPRPQPPSRGRRSDAPGRRRTVARPGIADRSPGLQRSRRPCPGRRCGTGRGTPAGSGRRGV